MLMLSPCSKCQWHFSTLVTAITQFSTSLLCPNIKRQSKCCFTQAKKIGVGKNDNNVSTFCAFERNSRKTIESNHWNKLSWRLKYPSVSANFTWVCVIILTELSKIHLPAFLLRLRPRHSSPWHLWHFGCQKCKSRHIKFHSRPIPRSMTTM